MLFLLLAVIFHPKVEFSFYPREQFNVFYMKEFWENVVSTRVYYSCDMEFLFEFNVRIGKLFLGGGAENFFGKSQGEIDNFYPYKANYKVKGYLDFGNVKVMYEHLCIHPVIPLISNDVIPMWQGMYDKLSIVFEK